MPDALVRRGGIHGCTSQPSRPHRRAAGLPVRPAPVIGVGLRRRSGAGEEGQHLADGGLLAGGFGQRQVGLDLIAVAAAVFLLQHVTGFGQVGDDAVGAAFGDAQAGREVAQPHARVAGDAQQQPGVAGQETPVRRAGKLP